MNIKVKQAILEAVKAEQQPPELANKIQAWLQSLMEGSEDVADQTAYIQRCTLCFDNIVVKNNPDK